ncbi:hypothetical protein PR048_022276 [Dryococelus australis]|uniref:Uncharacterized protein n=1 Tax=Dryococelus australis TaxID=614101 RepID=A0ABQ9H0K8_9NEOP|nr:hypothetical protein PR048_022276 [Dryococelus australis]
MGPRGSPEDWGKKKMNITRRVEARFFLSETDGRKKTRASRGNLPAIGNFSHVCNERNSRILIRRESEADPYWWEAGLKRHDYTGRGETGDPRENPPTDGIVRHDSHLRGLNPVRLGIGFDYRPQPFERISEEIWHTLNSEALRADEGDCGEYGVAPEGGSGWKREFPEKTRRSKALSGTIPTCENPGVTLLGIESGSRRWRTSRLTARPPFNSRQGHSKIFARRNRGRRCIWSTDFFGNIPFPLPLHSGAAPYSSNFTLSPSSADKISMTTEEWRRPCDVQPSGGESSGRCWPQRLLSTYEKESNQTWPTPVAAEWRSSASTSNGCPLMHATGHTSFNPVTIAAGIPARDPGPVEACTGTKYGCRYRVISALWESLPYGWFPPQIAPGTKEVAFKLLVNREILFICVLKSAIGPKRDAYLLAPAKYVLTLFCNLRTRYIGVVERRDLGGYRGTVAARPRS